MLSLQTGTPTPSPTPFEGTAVSSPELTAAFAAGFAVLAVLVVLARVRR